MIGQKKDPVYVPINVWINTPNTDVKTIANSEVAAASLGSNPSSIMVVVSAVPPPRPPRPEINPPEKELKDAITGLFTPKFNF